MSYENWKIAKQSYCLQNKLFTMDPTIFELWVMKTVNWVIKTLNPNGLWVFIIYVSNINFPTRLARDSMALGR